MPDPFASPEGDWNSWRCWDALDEPKQLPEDQEAFLVVFAFQQYLGTRAFSSQMVGLQSSENHKVRRQLPYQDASQFISRAGTVSQHHGEAVLKPKAEPYIQLQSLTQYLALVSGADAQPEDTAGLSEGPMQPRWKETAKKLEQKCWWF